MASVASPRAGVPTQVVVEVASEARVLVQTGGTNAAGLLTGGLGSAVAVANNPENQRFQKFVSEQGIDLAGLVRAAAAERVPAVASGSTGDARTLKIVVTQYGLLAGSLNPLKVFTPELRPTISVTAALVDASGGTLYSDTHTVSALMGDGPAHPLETFYAKPDTLKSSMRLAAISVADKVTQALPR